VTSIAEVQQFLPNRLHGPEWVGPVVLIFVAAGTWNAVRSPSPFNDLRPARLHAIAALCAIVLGVWVGISLHPLAGAIVLGVGCCLSLWSVLVSFGVTWRNHLRPGLIPAFLVVVTVGSGMYRPRTVALLAALVLWWAAAVRTRAARTADKRLQHILTRILLLTHIQSAEYFIREWFTRFRERASNLDLLSIATRAGDRARVYPRARVITNAVNSLSLLATLAEAELDQRMHTDSTVGRTTSWIRVQSEDLLRRTIEQSRIPRLLKFTSALMLAIPPVQEDAWEDGNRSESSAGSPDPEGYIVDIVAELPRFPTTQDLQAVKEQVLRQYIQSGPDWLTRLTNWAELWREQTVTEGRDCRIELVAEVLWGIYEADIGPRPSYFELFEQLRLQLPDLFDGLSVREAVLDDETDTLLITVNGLPKHFDVLTAASNGNREASRILLESRDRRRWVLKRLEITGEHEVRIVFRPDLAL
jgi:hypothetical protein